MLMLSFLLLLLLLLLVSFLRTTCLIVRETSSIVELHLLHKGRFTATATSEKQHSDGAVLGRRERSKKNMLCQSLLFVLACVLLPPLTSYKIFATLRSGKGLGSQVQAKMRSKLLSFFFFSFLTKRNSLYAPFKLTGPF